MVKIAKTAVIEDGAVIGEDVEIADFCFISKNAKIGKNTKIAHGACIYGKTTIGENNEIFSHAVLGSIPQDLKFSGEDVELIIGDNNKIREFTLFNPGTLGGGSKTVIGNGNLFMGYVHVAHDCIIQDNCIFANGATIAGHVEIDSFAVVGGMTPIHQFVKIGEHAMIAGASAVSQDIPPFCLAEGNRAYLRGLNLNGIRRRFERGVIDNLKKAYKELFESGQPLQDVAKELYKTTNCEEVRKVCNFIINTKRGIPFKRNLNGNSN
ncbi:MAG: acyl-ACP--UDP-N-acetylglucosamine O-acyltransferase [Campylobacterales bacterium]|nr:acyl-ACP--UDP-N-acetylglucosamine O-acyltransferase [Campylobacterales bacterium]